MKSGPLVSIGMPFYNPGVFFLDAVRSIFAQTYENWELILVDDGSTDNSLELARRINDPRVRVYSDGKHLGLVNRLNQIAQMASGVYLARMDADDLSHPERIAKQVAFLESHRDIEVVDTGAIVLNVEDFPVGVRGLEDRLPSAFEILKTGLFLHPSVMMRHEWALRHPYNPDYPRAEDRELWARVYNKTRFAHIPEPLFFYRFVGNVRVKAYLQSYHSERKVIMRYGPTMVGFPLSVYLYGRSLVKSVILIGLFVIRKEQLWNKIKYKGVPPKLLNEAVNTLKVIHRQQVPGWEQL